MNKLLSAALLVFSFATDVHSRNLPEVVVEHCEEATQPLSIICLGNYPAKCTDESFAAVDIVTGQSVNDITFLLTHGGLLYKKASESSSPELINTPENIRIVKFLFRNENEGVIVGNLKSGSANVDRSKKPSLFRGILRLVFGKKHREGPLKFKAGQHYLVGKPYTDHIAAYTKDGGKSWTTIKIPTNFSITDLVRIGDSYYVSTYGDTDHLDGDIWLLRPNKDALALEFAANRAVFGLAEHGNKLVAFGSDCVLVFAPRRGMAKIQGEILTLDVVGDSVNNVSVSDLQGNNLVTSLSYASDTVQWLVANGRLYRKSDKDFLLQNDPKIGGAKKVLSSDVNTVFVLTQSNNVEYTKDGGKTWFDYNAGPARISDIRQCSRSLLELFGANGITRTVSGNDLP